jgi:subtilisin family serine protease
MQGGPLRLFRRFIISALITVLSGSLMATMAFADTALFRLVSESAGFPAGTDQGNKPTAHKMVVEHLRSAATRNQAGFVAELENLKAGGEIESYRRFWIANIISVTADSSVLIELAGRNDVEEMFEDLPISLIAPVSTWEASAITSGHETGLSIIGAPEVWALGLDGRGSLVCNFDTGVYGNHPALMSKYRGNNGGVAASCWFDPYTNTDYPQDSHGHGTHTMGIMVGSVDGDTVGVAPGAQWIAAGVVDRGGGIQRSIADILAAFEWAADPDGDPSTVDDVPDVINNSWGIPLGYYPACDQTFWEAIDNVEAAGVICLFAAGNEGPFESTIRTPADRIASDFNCFSVGAVDGSTEDWPVAGFSSRGPSGCDGITVKPEVTAPGVGIRSASRTGDYVNMSGTSMATPHVAGAAAILRQFNPEATPSQIKQALMYSAEDLGQQGEDNDYGWGVIDIRGALYFMPPPDGVFPVVVCADVSGDRIADPGEEFGLSLQIENLGRPTHDIVASLECSVPGVNVLSGDLPIAYMDHLDTLTVGDWTVSFDDGIPIGAKIPFALTLSYADGDRETGFFVTAGGAVEPGVVTHSNGSLVMSISNIGQFGLGPGSLDPLGGEGFRYPPEGPDFLRNGALLLATDSYHVSDGAISSDPENTDDDFAPAVGGYPRIFQPGDYSDQDGFAVYSDSAAENPLGILVTQRSFCWLDPDDYPFVTVEFTLANISGAPIESLYAGIFCDWDLPLSSGNDDVVGYVDYESLGYVTDLSTGVSVGVKVITAQASSYAAIENFGLLDDGFSDAEKYYIMTSGFENVSYSDPGNYSHLITCGPWSINPGESEVVAFAFVAGDDLDDLVLHAREAFFIYPGLTGSTTDDNIPSRSGLITNYPNPFNGNTVIELYGDFEGSRAVNIYDIGGRLVRSLSLSGENRIIWDGLDGDGNEVAAGIYFARSAGAEACVRKMLLLK